MMSKVKMILTTACSVMLLMTSSGCMSSVQDGLNAMKTNTTVEEAVADIREIELAVTEAKRMVKEGDDSVYGERVHTDTVCFADVVQENDLKEKVKTKKIDGVSYKLYWDHDLNSAFWSTDGTDDIRNNENRVYDITHASAVEIKNKTNVTALDKYIK